MRVVSTPSKFLLTLTVFLTLFLGWMQTSNADAWPQYRGIQGNGSSTETVPQIDWTSSKPNEVWKVKTPLGFSSFAVADGRVFTLATDSDKETCLALDAQTGDTLWSVPLGSSKYKQGGGNSGAAGNKGGDGPRSTPATDGTLVFVYDSHMLLSCLDAAKGTTIWQKDIVKEFDGKNIKWLNATSPLLDGDRIYLTGGGAGQSFLAFNKNTGDVIWKSGDETMTHATPTLATIDDTKQIIFFAKSGLVSVDAENGDELWRSEFEFNVSTAASPVVEGTHVYCSAGYGVGAGLFKVEANESDEVWYKRNELMNHWSTPVVHNGHLYGIFEFKKYGNAPLQCVELATGEIKWQHRGFGPGNCILVGDKLIVLADDGHVVIAAAAPDKYNRTRTGQGA